MCSILRTMLCVFSENYSVEIVSRGLIERNADEVFEHFYDSKPEQDLIELFDYSVKSYRADYEIIIY